MKRVTTHIASVPEREEMLRNTVNSLINQCDHVYIVLNGYKRTPEWCENDKITTVLGDNKLGDAEKFRFTSKENGYILTCDDDLIYPSNYVEKMIYFIRYHVGCVISFHGTIFHPGEILHYYGSQSRKEKIHCLQGYYCDKMVDTPGSGVMGWDSRVIQFEMSEFKEKNMADIWVAVICKKKGIKMIACEHDAFWIKYQGPPKTIWDDHVQGAKITDTRQVEIYNSLVVK